MIAALGALVALLCTASALAAFAASHWLAELFVHFRLQYALLALLALVAAGLLRHRGLLAASALALVVNLPGAARDLLPAPMVPLRPALSAAALPVPAQAAAVVQLELVSANLWFRNAQHGRVLDWLRRESADVVFLMEVTPQWREVLRAMESRYPHSRYASGPRGRGVLLLSRWPLSELVVPRLQRGEGRAIFVSVTRDGVPLRLGLMHATWPFGPALARARAGDLAALAAEARAGAGRPFVALGDLNVTAHSPLFRRLLDQGALRDAAAGRGWQPTWPAGFPPLGIRIDHALVNAAVTVREYRRGPSIGSDHRPLRLGVQFGI